MTDRLIISLQNDRTAVQTVAVQRLSPAHVSLTLRSTRINPPLPGRYSDGDDDVMYLPLNAIECRQLAFVLSSAANAIDSETEARNGALSV